MKTRAYLTLLLAIAFALGPFLTPEFGGFDPALYPIPQDNPPVQPAGYAFAIWGVIYLWLIVHGALGALRHAEDPAWDASRAPLMGALAIGIFWLPVAMVSPLWAEVMIFAMLAGALLALFQAPRQVWTALAPLGLLAGWLSAASFAGLGLLGAGYGVFWGELGWAIAAIIGASVLALAVQTRVKTAFYGGAVIWALVAIAIRNSGDAAPVAALAYCGAILLLGVMTRQLTGAQITAARRPD